MRQLILLTLYLVFAAFIGSEESGIMGTMKDASGEPLIIATIKVYQKDSLIVESETDFDGLFYVELPVGVYQIQASYVGFETYISEVSVSESSFSELEITLAESLDFSEEVYDSNYEVQLIAADVTMPTRKKSKPLPSKTIAAIAATSAGVSVSDRGEISIRGSRPESTVYYIDGIRVRAENAAALVPQPILAEITSSEMAMVAKEEYIPNELREALPEAGLLTAGEWNDLKNWDTWQELITSGDYLSMVDHWSLAGLTRHSVFVTNEANIPLTNQKVELISQSGSVVWTARSDNSGSAELWLPEGIDNYFIQAKGSDKIKPNKQAASSDSYHLVLSEPCVTTPTLDIMFVVDATSSMHDEINYLRAELSNVIERVEVEQQGMDTEVRLGAVFYKDVMDDYLTAVTPLDKDITKSIEFIENKDAGGGGDTPEAVEAGLQEALDQDWNEAATSRLVFLILDAPPHHNEGVLKKLENQIREAAEKGIKIIPITASGIDRETEYLMKQISIMTNGTYVFLTDDSGIGNAHLEHVVPDYKVELLNDLLVRLITSYAKTYDCNETTIVENRTVQVAVKAYPNPTSGQMTVVTDQPIDQIVITSASGHRVMDVDNPEMETQVDLSQLIAGMYQLSVVVDGQMTDTQNVIKI